jgi:hypothetical protein
LNWHWSFLSSLLYTFCFSIWSFNSRFIKDGAYKSFLILLLWG